MTEIGCMLKVWSCRKKARAVNLYYPIGYFIVDSDIAQQLNALVLFCGISIYANALCGCIIYTLPVFFYYYYYGHIIWWLTLLSLSLSLSQCYIFEISQLHSCIFLYWLHAIYPQCSLSFHIYGLFPVEKMLRFCWCNLLKQYFSVQVAFCLHFYCVSSISC